MPPPLKAAILGYGKSGKNIHAPLIDSCNEVVLRAVLKRSGPETLADRPEVEVYRDLNSIINNDSIDLAVITAPNHLHFSMAFEALNAGKHVVVDKPFTVTVKESEELAGLARKQGKMITVFQNRRWDGDFLTVKKLLNEKAVGRPVEFESAFNRFRNQLRDNAWKEKNLPGSGILYDLGPHLIDQAIQLFGRPNSLYADIRSQRGGETDDWFEIDFFYDGFKARLKAGMLVLDDTPRFILRGDKGAYIKYGTDPQEQALADGKDPKLPGWGREDEKFHGTLYTWNSGKKTKQSIETASGNYPYFYRNVADAIQKNTEAAVKPKEAGEVIRHIELAVKSNREKKVLSL